MAIFSNDKAEIQKALKAMKAVSAGDFEARILNITSKGDLGELFHAINELIDRNDSYIRETKACMEHVSYNQYWRKIIETGMVGNFLDASKTVNLALEIMHKRASGFSSGISSFEQDVATVVSTVTNSAQGLDQSSSIMKEVALKTQEQSTTIAAAAEEASTNVQTIASASEQLTSSIAEISRQINVTSNMINEATDITHHVNSQVEELREAGDKIKEAVKLISEIAEQTNLLALNATIEAARAGEAGKGFAVVINEVKNLANQTADATDEISRFVNDIQDAMGGTIEGIEQVTHKISDITSANSGIATAVDEQSAATQEITRNIAQASTGTQEVSRHIADISSSAQRTGEVSGEVNQSAGELASQSANLSKMVETFLKDAKELI